MIKNRLKVLMAERNMTIQDLHELTKLSRTTISNLINESSESLQTGTLDILCYSLGITPGDFFEYSNYLLNFNHGMKDDNKFSYRIYLNVQHEGESKNYQVSVEFPEGIDFSNNNQTIKLKLIGFYQFKKTIFNNLSIILQNGFINDLKKELSKIVGAFLESQSLPKDGLTRSINFDFESEFKNFNVGYYYGFNKLNMNEFKKRLKPIK